MRIAAGYLLQESNTFSPEITHVTDFRLATGTAVLDRWSDTNTEIAGFHDAIRSELLPLFGGWAMTSGRIERSDFYEMTEIVRRAVREAGDIDGMLLALHGAMCAEGEDDCEGAIIDTVRGVIGRSLPLIVTLDLHANLTRRMVAGATAILGYKTYPHVDMRELGAAAARLMRATLSGEAHPVMAMRKLPMIVPAENMQTANGPMAEVFALGEAFRRSHPAILDTSVFGVQPWLDIEEMGGAVVVTADGNPAEAAECAGLMSKGFWERRADFAVPLLSPAEAIRRGLAFSGAPVVIGESADSPTGGSPGDIPEMLRALLESAPDVSAALCVRDEAAAALAWESRPGARIRVSLGGTVDRAFHRPVTVEGLVRSISDGCYRYKGKWNTGLGVQIGRTAVIDIGRISVVVSERPPSGIDPEIYRSQGIEPRDRKIVVVKSATAFRNEYGPFAAAIFMADTPGVTTANLATLPYRRVPRPIYPLDSFALTETTASSPRAGAE